MSLLLRPTIDAFSDYRAFMAQMIEWLRQEIPEVSYRTLADKGAFGSKSFLKHVVDGGRNIGPDSVAGVVAALGLTAREATVFERMVAFNQAKRDDAREEAYAELARVRRHPTATTERAQFDAYRRWFPMVLRELVGLQDFEEDPAWLGRRLHPKVAAKSVAAALGLLERLGLLVRDADGGLTQADVAVSTGATVRSLMVRSFHRKMLELASDSLDELPTDQRNVTGLMIPLTPDQYHRLTALISDFRAEVRRTFEEEGDTPASDDAVDIHQLLVSLIPLTKQVKKR